MRVFLTGASGFIGSAVLRMLLEQGIETAALISPGHLPVRLHDLETHQYHRIEGRLSDIPALRSELEAFKPDTCLHLAWYAEPGKYLYSPQNVQVLQQSLTAFQTLVEVGCQHFIGVGTCAEYDTDLGYLREDSPTKPATIYAACKLSMALIGQQMAAEAGINFAWARLFYLYGPQEDPRRLVPSLLQALKEGRTFDATAGEQVRDYLQLDDVASALITLAAQQANGIYNISSGYPITIREFMETVGQVIGNKSLIRFGVIPYRQWEPMFICGDNKKLKALGWKPQFTLRTGLEHLLATL